MAESLEFVSFLRHKNKEILTLAGLHFVFLRKIPSEVYYYWKMFLHPHKRKEIITGRKKMWERDENNNNLCKLFKSVGD